MLTHTCRLKSLLGGALLALLAFPALADDTEIYLNVKEADDARPNVLFILDTSGSMDTEEEITQAPYDPNTTYDSAGCSANRIYFSTGDKPPRCDTANWFPRTANNCEASQGALTNIGGIGVWPALGNARAQAAQYRNDKWRTLEAGNSGYVECAADSGVHGQNGTSTKPYVKNGSNPPWAASSTLSWGSLGDDYRFYTANYLNYRNGVGASVKMTRLQIVRDVAINLASSLENVNLGLMRYSANSEGGYVLNAVENIATSRDSIIDTLKGFSSTSGNGYTPLSETYYEAARYMSGKSVDYGNSSTPAHSVDASRTSAGGNTYKSPIQYQCQKSYLVYLTDGAPTKDDNANEKIEAMIGHACAADSPQPYHDSGWTSGSGMCMDELATWLSHTDLSSTKNGDQTALTYMIGFGSDVNTSGGYLDMIANAGGTNHAYTAADVATLTDALQGIFSSIQEDASTFVTPSLTVNAFNRAQTSSDLYFSLFKASPGVHWLGNLKKYELRNGAVRDVNGVQAINSDGFFAAGTTSFWSPEADGNDITRGGAVSQLPAAASREIYTQLSGSNNLTAAANAFSTSNSAVTDAVVGAGSSTTDCGEECQNTVNWARGALDAHDLDHDNNKTEAVKFMGDQLHGRPGIVTYSGTSDSPVTVVYAPTNDGFLHAIQGQTGTGGGRELWAFIPKELLPRLHDLYVNANASSRTYGLDGDIQVLKFDKNQNGTVDSGDRVLLFFGMRMGGSYYYALDVTNASAPQLLWKIGPDQLPGVGQTWSTPVITRVKVGTSGNTSSEKFVLIFGGGYDMGQEMQPYSMDSVGNRIFMVDAESGGLLWYAGGPGSEGTPNLQLPEMTNAIPARITVIDLNGDLFADRMYAADMGGRVWRFDIFNGQPASSLVTGGVFAQLGSGSNGTQPNSANRRFYNAPDVALIQQRGQAPYYNIAIGSGYRGHPLDKTTEERFYSLRDKQPFAQLTDYSTITPIRDGDLVDITADPAGTEVPEGALGWKFALNQQSGRSGEKVLSEATTVNGVTLFTTFQPVAPADSDPCYPANINRAYAITTATGKPALDFNDSGTVDNADLSVDLRQQGIVGDVAVALLRPDDANPDDPNSPPGTPSTICIAGVEVLKKCVNAGGTVRTFWQRNDAR